MPSFIPVLFRIIAAWVFLLPFFEGCKPAPGLFVLRKAADTGIDFENRIIESDSINPLDMEFLYNGGGVAARDLNGDGLTDLFFTGNQVSNRCYLNRGGLRFEDVTDRAGLNSLGLWANGVSIADVNGDGLPDVYICNSVYRDPSKRRNRFYLHRGNGPDGIPRFEELGIACGIADSGYGVQAAFFDYDLDQDLDLYLVNTKLATRNGMDFQPAVDSLRIDEDRLFRNDGNSEDGLPHFTDVTTEAGIHGEGFGLGIGISDMNRDGWPDIYVTNDYFSNDALYVNSGDGHFLNQIDNMLGHTAQNAMGLDIADLNNDRWPDILSVDMNPADNLRKKKNLGANGYYMHQNMASGRLFWQYVRNAIQINQGPRPLGDKQTGLPFFTDMSFQLGLAETDWSWNIVAADMDLDGRRDVMITNGYPKDVTDRDFGAYRNRNSGKETKAEIIAQIPTIKVANYAFQQQASGEFKNLAAVWGMDEPSFSNGAVCADLDNDGDLDYVVNNINQEAFLYENLSSAASGKPPFSLTCSFRGPAGNQDGIGAFVEIFSNGQCISSAENFPVRGYLSCTEPSLFFGLDTLSRLDSLIIRWPGGKTQVCKEIKAGKIVLEYEKAGRVASVKHMLDAFSLGWQPWSSGIPYRHQEMDFIDFDTERLLPRKLSQQGPPMTKADINGDGFDDFFIGGSGDYPGVFWLQNKAGGFDTTRLNMDAWPFLRRGEMTAALFFDADQDGDQDLYIGYGGNESGPDSKNLQDLLWLNDGKGGFRPDTAALPVSRISTGCVRVCDYDRDGDLDLFVGNRGRPGQYPLSGPSQILRNDIKEKQVKFTNVTQEVIPQMLDAGMITEARWTDLNADGWMDLVVCGEWRRVSYFLNQQGKFSGEVYLDSVGKGRGWWTCMEASDLDQDGDMDIIVGNLGWNSVFGSGSKWPVSLYPIDLDRNGLLDPIMTYHIPDGKGKTREFPVAFRDELIAQIPALRKRFPTYASFGEADVSDILNVPGIQSSSPLVADQFSTGIYWNEGNGRYVFQALLPIAQATSINKIYTTDLNGDALTDLILLGGDTGSEVTNGKMDGWSVRVLLGSGQRRFDDLPAISSGFFMRGDAKSLVEINSADGSKCIAIVSYRDSLHLFKKNISVPIRP